MRRIELINTNGNVLSMIDTTDPDAEIEFYGPQLGAVAWREYQAALLALRERMFATDYKTLKFVDGSLTAAEYEPIKTRRSLLRAAYSSAEIAEIMEGVQHGANFYQNRR